MNMSLSPAHMAVSGMVELIKKVTIIYWPQATTVAVTNPAIRAPLTPPVALPNTPAVAEWKKSTIMVGTNIYPTVLPKTTSHMRAPTKEPTKPSMDAVGA